MIHLAAPTVSISDAIYVSRQFERGLPASVVYRRLERRHKRVERRQYEAYYRFRQAAQVR